MKSGSVNICLPCHQSEEARSSFYLRFYLRYSQKSHSGSNSISAPPPPPSLHHSSPLPPPPLHLTPS